MFERFTDRARQAVVLAQKEARELGHGYVGTEHILLGLLAEGGGQAARILEALGLSLDDVRAEILRIVAPGGEVTASQIPFTPRAKKVLELALREALSLGHDYIGTEHILLGLVREHEGVANQVLLDFDAGPEKIRNAVIQAVSGPGSRRDRAIARSQATIVGEDFSLVVRPDRELRRLLMITGGRALSNERHEFGLADLLAAAREIEARPGTEPDRGDPI